MSKSLTNPQKTLEYINRTRNAGLNITFSSVILILSKIGVIMPSARDVTNKKKFRLETVFGQGFFKNI